MSGVREERVGATLGTDLTGTSGVRGEGVGATLGTDLTGTSGVRGEGVAATLGTDLPWLSSASIDAPLLTSSSTMSASPSADATASGVRPLRTIGWRCRAASRAQGVNGKGCACHWLHPS
eukprot:365591-Chlamydomonas_euryale.AAC.10